MGYLSIFLNHLQFPSVTVKSLSHVWLSVTPWTVTHQASLSFTISWSLLKVMSTELMMPSNCLILCHPLLLLPSIFPSIWVFSSKLTLYIRWPKYWIFIISPSNEYSGLISFRIDWFDLLAVQGTLERVFSSTTFWKHQLFDSQPSLWFSPHIHTWVLEKPYLWLYRPWLVKWCLCFLIQTNHSEVFWQNVVKLEKVNHTIFLMREPHQQYEKAKRYDTRWAPPPWQKLSNMLLGKSRGLLLITTEWMKSLGQAEMMFRCGCVWW